MNRKLLTLSATLVGLGALLFASPVLATSLENVQKDGISKVASGQTVDGAAFLFGNAVSVDGTVNGDVFCAGGDITINGTVNGDVICAGNNLTIAGTVKGDVRVSGNVIRLEGQVNGSTTVAGASLQVAQSAKLDKDVTIGAGTVNVRGEVGRDLKVGGANVVISTTIGRNVYVEADTFNLDGSIAGNLDYRVNKDVNIPEGSVAGEVKRLEARQEHSGKWMNTASFAAMALIGVLASVVLTLVVVLIMPRYVRRVTDLKPVGLLKAFLVGLASFGLLIPLLIILFISIVGFTVAFTLMLAFGLVVMLALPLVSFWVGRALFGQTSRSIVFMALIGALIVSIVGVLPWLGALVLLVAVCIGIGMIVLGFGDQYGKDAYSLVPEKVIAEKPKAVKAKK